MFSSLLPLRSKESVTGGLMVKPLVQSQLQSVVVNATGRCDKVLERLIRNIHEARFDNDDSSRSPRRLPLMSWSKSGGYHISTVGIGTKPF